MKDLGINYPVAIDNEFKIWRAFNNEYWPAHYFADAQGVSAITTLAKALRRIGAGHPATAA
jgi:hypothetical protein